MPQQQHLTETQESENTITTPAQMVAPETADTPLSYTARRATEEEMEKQQVDVLLAQLSRDSFRQKRQKRLLRGATLIYSVLMVTAAIAMMKMPAASLGYVLLLLPLMLIGLQLVLTAGKSKQTHTFQQAARYDNPRLIGPMLEALSAEPNLRQTILNRLTPSLRQMKATDSHLLNEEQRAHLYRYLEKCNVTSRNQAFLIAALQALQQIGDHKALPAVKRLAGGGNWTVSVGYRFRAGRKGGGERLTSGGWATRFQGVQTAAKECLPYIEAQAAQVEANRTLLRAADGNLTSPEVLLRPAAAAPEIPAEQLLRAGVSPSGE